MAKREKETTFETIEVIITGKVQKLNRITIPKITADMQDIRVGDILQLRLLSIKRKIVGKWKKEQ